MRRFLIALFFLVFVFFKPQPLYAAGEFSIDSSIYYLLSEDGSTQVTHEITLENLYTDYYATSYSLSLHNINPGKVKAFSGSSTLDHKVEYISDKEAIIQVLFPDTVVGIGKKREFSIRYTDPTIGKKTGEVWEISIPKLVESEAFRNYTVTISAPTSFGEIAYVSPSPQEKKIVGSQHVLKFSKENLIQSGVTAAFGKFQVFSFDLTYHLENPLQKRGSIEIAVPPDTAYQRVLLENIAPPPLTINKDQDGNWLAYFILEPRQRVDVKVKGTVQIYPDPRPFARPSDQSLKDSLKESLTWQVNDPAIKKLAGQLKTPRAIYDYVVNTLTYDYERVKPNVVRLGAVEALKNPGNAICMEFTDLFIALARAAGIPAREVNGYAYTENPEIEPLSLVADVLHAWPEYWDETRGLWVPVDPTWGNTTGGIDFFNKLDLRHFSFVHHGKDANQPYAPGSYKLGPDPQKDIYVSFSSLPFNRESRAELKVDVINNPLFKDMQLVARVKNTGVASLDSALVQVHFDDKKQFEQSITNLPPYAVFEVPITVPFNLLGSRLPENISVTLDNQKIVLPTHKTSIIILNISAVLLLIFLILLLVVIRIRRINLSYAITTIKNAIHKRLPRRKLT